MDKKDNITFHDFVRQEINSLNNFLAQQSRNVGNDPYYVYHRTFEEWLEEFNYWMNRNK